MQIYKIIALIHVLVGGISLLSFWITLLMPKGSPAHRLCGKIFLLAMIGVGATTLPLVVGVFSQGFQIWSIFLLFLTYFVGTQCWTAWRAIRDRADWYKYLANGYRALAWGNLIFGTGILVLGIVTGRVLLTAFSFAGIFNGSFNLRTASREPKYGQWWLAEHLRGMLNNGVATHVSFLTLGFGKIFPALKNDYLMYGGWLGTLSIGILLRIYLEWRVAKGGSLL